MVVLHSSMIKTLNILIEQKPNETTDGHRLTQIKTFFLYSISVHPCLSVVAFIISLYIMKSAIVTITPQGLKAGRRIQEDLKCNLYAPEEILTPLERMPRHPSFLTGLTENRSAIIGYKTIKELVDRVWGDYDSLIFIMAMGIVIRIIKDHIQDKHMDPAVVVVDEMGRYAISALSGHEGGANRLAERVALICQGDFVITTGSEATKTLIIGMGCRRGTSVDYLEDAMMEGLRLITRELKEVRLIASIEDKRDEKGLLQLSERLNIPLKFIHKVLIKTVEEGFSKSELVKNTLGVYSVAEPCAILGGFRCQLLLPKTKMKGTTIAIAEERFL